MQVGAGNNFRSWLPPLTGDAPATRANTAADFAWQGAGVRAGLAATTRPAESALGDLNASSSTSEKSRHDKLVHESRRLVSQTFFGTLLKQMHDSPFKSELFAGGKGGQAFSPLLDQQYADRLANSSGRRLADSIVKHIERHSQNKQSQTPETWGAASSTGGGDDVQGAR